MSQYPITITEAKTFPPATNKYLGIKFTTPDRGIQEGTVWDQELWDIFKIGTSLLITVGQGKDPVAWDEYKGKQKLSIRKGAEIAFQAGAAQPAAQQAAYQPPQAAAAPQTYQHPAPATATTTAHAGGRGEQLVDRHTELILHQYNELVRQGAPEELAIRAAAEAPRNCAMWFFGEKGV